MAEHLNTRIGCYSKILITHTLQAIRTSIAFNENSVRRLNAFSGRGIMVSYRRKIKNGDREHKAHNNVEHTFGDDFDHSLPPDSGEGALNCDAGKTNGRTSVRPLGDIKIAML